MMRRETATGQKRYGLTGLGIGFARGRGENPILNKQASLKESDIQTQVKQYLQYKGWFIVKIHQSLGSYKGIADLYAIRKGRHIWLEVKAAKGILSVYQKQFREDVESHGGEYRVVRGIEDVEDL